MEIDWAFRRRVITVAIVVAAIGIIALGVYFWLRPAETCFDGKKNQDEKGVDCSGVCSLQCKELMQPITAVWTKSFPVRKGIYDIAALIENHNLDAGVSKFDYTVELFDASGRTLLSRPFSTFANAGDHFLLFAGGLDTRGVPATDARLTINPSYAFTRSSQASLKKVSVTGYTLISPDDKPRLIATIQNETTESFRNLPVTAMISDKHGPVAVSQTFIEELPPREKRVVTYTWPEALKYESEGEECAAPVDVVLVMDRSGSMRSDGKDPDQPLNMAKDAARDFVGQLKKGDQAGYITFATDVTSPIEKELTEDAPSVDDAIAKTEISASGTQYTNIAAALDAARNEIVSDRKRKGAMQAVVFLTDGEPTYPKNPANEKDDVYPADEGRKAATALKDENVALYVIGLGAEVKSEYLTTLASYPEYYFPAASGSELGSIYRQIGKTICKKGPSVVEIIPRINEVGETTTR